MGIGRSRRMITAMIVASTLMTLLNVVKGQVTQGLKQGPRIETSQRAINGKVAFSSNESGNYELYLVDANGKNRIQLTNNSGDDLDPTWSPDGKSLAFLSNRDGNFEIYSISMNGSNEVRLTNTASDEFDPVWSPSGLKIAFSSAVDGNLEVYSINANGSGQTNLTQNRADDAFPTWSPDSTRIAFSSDRTGNAEIFVMNADGSGQTNISNNPANDDFPAWSPNGRFIAFSSDRFQGFDVFIMNPDGNNQVRLTDGSKEESYPSWSPDSSKILYTAGTLEKNSLGNNDLFVLTLNGNSQNSVARGSADEIFPDWQPLLVVAPPVNPIDDPTLFVRQQYLDFLNREPDPSGLAFWVSQITSCGSDTQCIATKRVNVSAAFFLSIEFQQTGYLVYRSYKAAYGNLPGAPVPLRFSEFLADMQEISQGLVVGQNGWEQVLENNKQFYFSDFVTRSRFANAYPTTLSPAQFVDALFLQAGFVPSAADRTAAINEFSGAANTSNTAARPRALRRVAENSTLAQQEFNKAFVLMEYFGYLRRNPNDAPEPALDYSGYSFWLAKLNQFNGNFTAAEMVKAFLTSNEYRQRFGS